MTIKLLTPRDLTIGGRTVTYPAGALVTLDAATETGLINSKEATATLTGGITYTPPVPSGQPVPLTATTSAQGIGNPGIRGRGQVTLGDTRQRLGKSTYAIHQYLKDVIRRAKGGRVATLGASPIAFRCDHGMQDFFTSYFTEFESRGIPCTMGLVTRAIGNPADAYEPCSYTWAQIREYHHRGIPMWSHSHTHTDPAVIAAQNGTTTEEELEREVCYSKLLMLQNNIIPIGWQQPGIANCGCEHYSSNFFAPDSYDSLPGQLILENYGINENNNLEKQHDGSVVSVGGKYRYLPTDGANDLGHVTLDDLTLAQAKAVVDNALMWRVGLQFMFHPRFMELGITTFKRADMIALLDYVAGFRDQGKAILLSSEGLAFADMDATFRSNIFAEDKFQSGVVPGAAGSKWYRSGSVAVALTTAQDGTTGNYIVTQPPTAAGYIYQSNTQVVQHKMWGHAFSAEVDFRNTAETVSSQLQIAVYVDNVLVPGTARLQTVAADSTWKTLRQIFCVPIGTANLQVRISRPLGDGNIEYKRFGVYPT